MQNGEGCQLVRKTGQGAPDEEEAPRQPQQESHNSGKKDNLILVSRRKAQSVLRLKVVFIVRRPYAVVVADPGGCVHHLLT